ncbi:MAG: lipid A deacylase LpxR family protein [Alphaproteobacteria bacterium]|nr:lipid A deacylase LpxR family protein [Alphaproteobacteria bacterium]
MKPRIAFATCLILAGTVELARAEDGEKPGVFSFLLENDTFADSDKYYTNGVKLSYLAPDDPLPSWLDPVDRMGRPVYGDEARVRWGFAIGQSLYTPSDTSLTVPDPTDRPYAAWLYGALSLVAYSEGESIDTIELHMGVVGPSALGEEVQNGFHDLINDGEAQGWDYQLEDEFGIMVLAEHRWVSQTLIDFDSGLGLDFSPHVGIALGNVQTYAAAGAMLRFGQNLSSDFGAPRIRPALSGSAFFDGTQDFAWYVFAGVEGRAVAQDIFLDGNTFSDSPPSVDKNWLVGDVQAGVSLILYGTRITYSYVHRTEEFEGQEEAAEFGAISISRSF